VVHVDDYGFLLAERARIEAQIRAAEAAARLKEEAELKQQRQREREAARVALQKVYFCLIVLYISNI
jgi:hypothetical protein